jgi:predicted transcriptional regulator
MRVLWARRVATVTEVHQALEGRGLALATIATLLRRLEKKGAITHEVQGRQFVYKAAVSADAVRRSMLTEVAEKLLPSEVPALINHLFDADKIGADELVQVKKLIARKEREARGK